MITRDVLLFCFFLFVLHLRPAQSAEENFFFDPSAPEFETTLNPTDFVAYSEGAAMDAEAATDSESWDSDAMYQTDKFEGDIANDLNASTVPLFIQGAVTGSQNDNRQLNAIRDRRQLWPNGRIPYAISSQYSSYSRSVIAASMNEFEKNTCIKWSPRTNADTSYVYIMPDRGCYSMVGRTGGRQILSLGNGCIQKGIIIHEMSHATGFFHEQSRTDRDQYISILWANVMPGMEGQFEKYSPVTIQNLGADYDYGSIMHYGQKAFSKNGLPTIVPKRKVSIGQRSGFSETDTRKINLLYECPGVKPEISVSVSKAPLVVVPTVLPPTTASPPIVPTEIIPTVPAVIARPTAVPLVPAENCTNSRPDCDQLATQGWCSRNAHWMRDFCPLSCGMCIPLPSVSTSNGGVCEDLRVDCPELVKKRYCITAQKFTANFCRRSCGFCFAPPVTETPDLTHTLAALTTTSFPPLPTKQPLVTFWPLVNRPEDRELSSTISPSTSAACRDKAQYCAHWSKAGYCNGIFGSFMKSQCPLSCGLCR